MSKRGPELLRLQFLYQHREVRRPQIDRWWQVTLEMRIESDPMW